MVLKRLYRLLGLDHSNDGVPPGVDVLTANQLDNPILRLLTTAGIPWQSPRHALATRYGVCSHPAYEWDVIEIAAEKPLVTGLLWPLSVHVIPQFCTRMPALEFSGEIWFKDDSRHNLRTTAQQLRATLGPARIVEQGNTVQCQWTCGETSLGLIAWPGDLKNDGWPGHIPAHEREPRLATACHIRIHTGVLPAVTPQERAWLDSFVPLGRIRINGAPSAESELEYLRTPTAGLERIEGHIGHSSGKDALIFRHRQLYLVPMADVTTFRVVRLLPAKGSGGSWLMAECRAHDCGVASKQISISAAPGADDLNDFAAAIAAATGKPFVLGGYESDC